MLGSNRSDATGHMESYEIPLEMGSVLPDACPSYKFRTCAVVGNSGTMLFEKFGDDINRHEMVYRFNQVIGDSLLKNSL